MELTFEVIQQLEGSFVAACYSENIYTEGSSLEELHNNITSLIDYRFQGRTKPDPSSVKLMLFRE
jgi:predicted RNase H-like HicB family nuclease